MFSGRKAQLAPQPIGDQAVQAGAFVHFVEVRHRLAGEQHAAGLRADFTGGRSTLFSRPSTRSLAGRKVLQALLVLDADGGAAELVGEPDGGDVHLALLQGLGFGQFGLLVAAPVEGHALLQQPVQDLAGFGVADLLHGGVQGGLAQPLLEHAGRVAAVRPG